MNYRETNANISRRYNPDANYLVERRMFSGEGALDNDVVRYVKRAMNAVDEEYTRKTKEAGENAKMHLKESLENVSYEYQGSVMTDTHIKGVSDIDLLVLCEKFQGTEIGRVRQELQSTWKYNENQIRRLNNYNSAFNLYRGDSISDLAILRRNIELIMIQNYEICDISKAKSVRITNQHLHRDVDVVTASWFQSLDYVLEGMPDEMRGIKIFNKNTQHEEGPDFPFLSIKRINDRSAETYGRLKRMIRFLKNVRTDSGKSIPLTSFDINALCYSIPTQEYINLDYINIVRVLWSTMYHLWYDNKLDSLKSVVGDEYIFKNHPDKVNALKTLEDEVYKIYQDLSK